MILLPFNDFQWMMNKYYPIKRNLFLFVHILGFSFYLYLKNIILVKSVLNNVPRVFFNTKILIPAILVNIVDYVTKSAFCPKNKKSEYLHVFIQEEQNVLGFWKLELKTSFEYMHSDFN